jgi:NAD(P)-dependent dehydrogenase (short-subunit alcohol dehydrogenase family)
MMSSEIMNANRTVIVTGGSQGIGGGAVKAFLDRGYNAIVYLKEANQVTGEALHVDGGAHAKKW